MDGTCSDIDTERGDNNDGYVCTEEGMGTNGTASSERERGPLCARKVVSNACAVDVLLRTCV